MQLPIVTSQVHQGVHVILCYSEYYYHDMNNIILYTRTDYRVMFYKEIFNSVNNFMEVALVTNITCSYVYCMST